jgi:multisubunit Na+/H+ antiporter MnhF subunit
MTLAQGIQFLALFVFAAATLLGLLRFLLGPATPDRLVATDTLTVVATSILVFMAAFLDSELYLDVALVYGVLAFVGVIALARIIETGHK